MVERFKQHIEATRLEKQQTQILFCLQKLLESQQWATRNTV